MNQGNPAKQSGKPVKNLQKQDLTGRTKNRVDVSGKGVREKRSSTGKREKKKEKEKKEGTLSRGLEILCHFQREKRNKNVGVWFTYPRTTKRKWPRRSQTLVGEKPKRKPERSGKKLPELGSKSWVRPKIVRGDHSIRMYRWKEKSEKENEKKLCAEELETGSPV